MQSFSSLKTKLPLFALLVSVLLLVPACVPQLEYGVRVAVIGAPTEARVPGLADLLQTRLSRERGEADFGFIGRNRVAFQETHRDMYGSRSALQAAFIAEQFGAEYALTVAAPVYVRDVREGRGFGEGKRFVSVAVQLEAVIYNPTSAERVATYVSPVYRSERIESVNRELKDKAEDPDVRANLARGVDFLAPPVATDLAVLAGLLGADAE